MLVQVVEKFGSTRQMDSLPIWPSRVLEGTRYRIVVYDGDEAIETPDSYEIETPEFVRVADCWHYPVITIPTTTSARVIMVIQNQITLIASCSRIFIFTFPMAILSAATAAAAACAAYPGAARFRPTANLRHLSARVSVCGWLGSVMSSASATPAASAPPAASASDRPAGTSRQTRWPSPR